MPASPRYSAMRKKFAQVDAQAVEEAFEDESSWAGHQNEDHQPSASMMLMELSIWIPRLMPLTADSV